MCIRDRYGVAAAEVLEAFGIWEVLHPRMVFGENVAQALQYVRTGNADAGIVALGLVIGAAEGEPLPHRVIDAGFHLPLRQAAGILSESERQEQAAAFLEFVTSPPAREILRRYGFQTP